MPADGCPNRQDRKARDSPSAAHSKGQAGPRNLRAAPPLNPAKGKPSESTP